MNDLALFPCPFDLQIVQIQLQIVYQLDAPLPNLQPETDCTALIFKPGCKFGFFELSKFGGGGSFRPNR